MNHIVDTCPLTKFEGGRNLLHEADDDTVIWLESVRTHQWRRQDFVTGGVVRYGSVGGLEYEVPQKLTHLLQCIGNL